MNETEKRELLIRIAEKVMGWTLRKVEHRGKVRWIADVPIPGEESGTYPLWICGDYPTPVSRWLPLESISDAWMLVEALNKRMWMFTAGQLFDSAEARSVSYVVSGHRYQVRDGQLYGGAGGVQEYAETLPLAICLAADAAAREME